MKDLAGYLAIFVVYVTLNLAWLSLVALDLYRRELTVLLVEKPRVGMAALFYLLHSAGILVLAVRPALAEGAWQKAALFGALFGLCTYATYDLTNAATLRRWPSSLVVLDLTCGTVLTSLAALGGFFAARSISFGSP
jgi:uncharacterized membrane protein